MWSDWLTAYYLVLERGLLRLGRVKNICLVPGSISWQPYHFVNLLPIQLQLFLFLFSWYFQFPFCVLFGPRSYYYKNESIKKIINRHNQFRKACHSAPKTGQYWIISCQGILMSFYLPRKLNHIMISFRNEWISYPILQKNVGLLKPCC